jgi:hypothetical protein
MDESVHVPGFLGREVVLDVEALDLACKAASQRRGIEFRDVGDPRAPGDQVAPALGNAVAYGLMSPSPVTTTLRRVMPIGQAFWWLTA